MGSGGEQSQPKRRSIKTNTEGAEPIVIHPNTIKREEQMVSSLMTESRHVTIPVLFVSTHQAIEIVQPAHTNLHLSFHNVVNHRG